MCSPCSWGFLRGPQGPRAPPSNGADITFRPVHVGSKRCNVREANRPCHQAAKIVLYACPVLISDRHDFAECPSTARRVAPVPVAGVAARTLRYPLHRHRPCRVVEATTGRRMADRHPGRFVGSAAGHWRIASAGAGAAQGRAQKRSLRAAAARAAGHRPGGHGPSSLSDLNRCAFAQSMHCTEIRQKAAVFGGF